MDLRMDYSSGSRLDFVLGNSTVAWRDLLWA